MAEKKAIKLETEGPELIQPKKSKHIKVRLAGTPVRSKNPSDSKTAGVLTYVGPNDTLEEIDRIGNWVQIVLPGLPKRIGWIHASTISK